MIDKMMRTSKLLDIYGSLLTEVQLNQCRLHFDQDYSLSEIAEEYKVSRQAVHDAISRASSVLDDFESKLGLLRHYELIDELQKNLVMMEPVMKSDEVSDETRLAYSLCIDIISDILGE